MQFNCGTPLKTMLFCWGPYGILAYYAAVKNATLVSPKLRMVRKSCLKHSRHPKNIVHPNMNHLPTFMSSVEHKRRFCKVWFCVYNESQWVPKQHWKKPLIYQIFFRVPQKKKTRKPPIKTHTFSHSFFFLFF